MSDHDGHTIDAGPVEVDWEATAKMEGEMRRSTQTLANRYREQLRDQDAEIEQLREELAEARHRIRVRYEQGFLHAEALADLARQFIQTWQNDIARGPR